jgi:hypothetical protein
MQFTPDRPPREVDTALRESLEEVRRAEKNAVLWFAEIVRRRLYRDLGFGSIHQYAATRLGFSKVRTAQFLRLAESLESLPRLRESLESGRTSWTKAREVARVATPRTEATWVQRAETCSRQDLEKRVATVKAKAKRRRTARGQESLSLEPASTRPAAPDPADDPTEVPVTVTLRMSPVQAARYEALREKARKRGYRESEVDLVLAGLEDLVAGEGVPMTQTEAVSAGRARAGGAPAETAECSSAETQPNPEATDREPVASSLRRFPRGNASPYEIHVAVCPRCERGRVETTRGSRTLDLPQLRAAACDARVRGREGGNRSTIPPRVRRLVLDRDGHRCRATGCDATRFLEVHHRTPRSRGGSNRPDNLITLCSGCHRATHLHEPGDDPLRN